MTMFSLGIRKVEFEVEKVQVLLSSYNGEKYIAEQLESIFSQKEIDVSCFVRDDGSADGTAEVLKKFARKGLRVMYDKNKGWKKGFYELVYLADEAPFYAFADQDDVWKEWKLKRAVDKLKELPQQEPCLYYSNVSVTDEALNIMGEKVNLAPPQKKESALNICYGQGCTMVFNCAARELFMRYRIEEPISHECWMSILCIYFGNVVYDNCSTLLYRQHGDNSLGAEKKTRFGLLRERLHKKADKQAYYPYYRYLYEGYNDLLSEEDKAVVLDCMNYKNDWKAKMRLLLNRNIKRYTKSGTLMLKAAIATNRI